MRPFRTSPTWPLTGDDCGRRAMTPLDYFRPKSIDEALKLLQRGLPLGGGTALTPRRRQLPAVVDLQGLGLDALECKDNRIIAGAALTLQKLAEAGEPVPAALAEACRREAGLNLRNVATLAGALVTCDGRSPLATVLLAMGAEAVLEPGSEVISLDNLLDRRAEEMSGRLIVSFHIPCPRHLGYEQVGRSPADLPLVCAAVATLPGKGKQAQYRVALGGFGKRPIRLLGAEAAASQEGKLEAAAEAARLAYAGADDAWASAEYRSAVAGVLVRRLLAEAVD
jgi:probable selenate reductase FAD-binding subunit